MAAPERSFSRFLDRIWSSGLLSFASVFQDLILLLRFLKCLSPFSTATRCCHHRASECLDTAWFYLQKKDHKSAVSSCRLGRCSSPQRNFTLRCLQRRRKIRHPRLALFPCIAHVPWEMKGLLDCCMYACGMRKPQEEETDMGLALLLPSERDT